MQYHLAPIPSSELREDLRVFGGPLDEIVSRRWPFATSRTIDLGAALLPPITTAGFDVASRTVTWTTGAPVTPDVQVVSLSYTRNITKRFSWAVIASSELGSSFTIPQLPADMPELMPLATDRISGAVAQIKLGNGLSFAQVESNIVQWLFTGYPNGIDPVNWAAAPANLDAMVRSNATF